MDIDPFGPHMSVVAYPKHAASALSAVDSRADIFVVPGGDRHLEKWAQGKGDPVIEQKCIERGLRMTDQRRVIARVLSTSSDHPDAEELHRRAVTVDANISLATVYRTVKLFEDFGIIERHDFRDGRSRYEESPVEHHDHLIDAKTGQVIEFKSEEIERLQIEIARSLGYRLVDHRLELYGVPLEEGKGPESTG